MEKKHTGSLVFIWYFSSEDITLLSDTILTAKQVIQKTELWQIKLL